MWWFVFFFLLMNKSERERSELIEIIGGVVVKNTMAKFSLKGINGNKRKSVEVNEDTITKNNLLLSQKSQATLCCIP